MMIWIINISHFGTTWTTKQWQTKIEVQEEHLLIQIPLFQAKFNKQKFEKTFHMRMNAKSGNTNGCQAKREKKMTICEVRGFWNLH